MVGVSPTKEDLLFSKGVVLKESKDLFTFLVNILTFDLNHPHVRPLVRDDDRLALHEEVPEDCRALQFYCSIILTIRKVTFLIPLNCSGLTVKWSCWRVMARLRTMSVVVSELLLSLSTVAETGLLLMYHWRRGAGRDPLRLQLSLSLSPGEADTGGRG